MLNEGCQIGSDGSGGFEKNPRLRKMASSSRSYNKDFTVFAILVSRVPGKQTVPRSELWAIYQAVKKANVVIQIWITSNITDKVITFYIDALYVINGIATNI